MYPVDLIQGSLDIRWMSKVSGVLSVSIALLHLFDPTLIDGLRLAYA